jgi:hypothetical protein
LHPWCTYMADMPYMILKQSTPPWVTLVSGHAALQSAVA